MDPQTRAMVFGALGVAALIVALTVYAAAAPDRVAPRAGAPATSAPAPSASVSGPTPSVRPSATIGPRPSATASPRPRTPAPTGWPNATNTGVPAGVKLTAVGSLNITTPGTVIDAKQVTGCITVRANNVTIKRTRVLATAACGGMVIDTGDFNKYRGIVIEDVEIDGRDLNPDNAAIGFSGFTVRRANIHRTGSGFRLGRGGTGPTNMTAVIQDSYIWDLYTGNGSHNAGIGAFSSKWVRGTHNRVECLDYTHCTGAMTLLTDENGGTNNITYESNLFAGGGFTVYAGMYAGPDFNNIRWLRNQFVRGTAEYGPVIHADNVKKYGNEWSGNKWSDNGQAINL